MKTFILIVMLVALIAAVAVFLRYLRASSGVNQALDSAERRELNQLRALTDRLLTEAIDRRDVDNVLAPLVIDEIRSHQRSLHQKDR